MYITLIVLFLSAIFFMSGKVRSDLVALCALVLLIIFGILTPEEALTGFSNSVVIMMIGLFVVGGAIFQTGLAKMISSRILKLAGDSELKLFILIVLVTAFIGAFVSNTGTVALMLPIVVSIDVYKRQEQVRCRVLQIQETSLSLPHLWTLYVSNLFVRSVRLRR